jgi:tyrosinase
MNETLPSSEHPTASSRYERVKSILDAAAGQSTADYQGYGRFWHLPLDEFLQVSIYGQRMVAPAPPAAPGSTATAKNPCHCPSDPAGQIGRGAASGLVRGLRGQFPFDGEQFPPLPWGGMPVTEPDISFIERWIDDGCPATDASEHVAGAATVAQRRALARGDAPHLLHDGPANQVFGNAGALRQRKNIRGLSDDEWCRLRAAIARMKSLDPYYQDERSFAFWARIHADQCQHGWEEFLTWHRAYLYFFELQLQDIDETVTLPYWDWTADAENVRISIEDAQHTGNAGLDNGIVPAPYQCWMSEDGLRRLTEGGKVPDRILGGLRGIIDKPFSSGWRLFTAAGIQYGAEPASDDAIKAELGAINPLFHWRRWPGGNSSLIFEAYPTLDDVSNILQIQNFFDFASGSTNNRFFGALENIHNLIHNYTGGVNPYYANGAPMVDAEPFTGDMVNAGVTAFDPIFWAHHANVDRLWAEWQHRNPQAGPDDPADILPPWNMTVSDTYSTQKLGYEYVLTSHVFPTDNTLPLQRFRSAAVAVKKHVLDTHQRAEIRVHAMQQVPRPGFFIRAFLNMPGANVDTAMRGNDHYVGQMNVFTGLCIGGPGHCDVPARSLNRFDRRPPHHKTPSSVRFDATDAVRKLSAAGVTDFEVNLVTLNIDGTPATDALLVDAVSLNFKD